MSPDGTTPGHHANHQLTTRVEESDRLGPGTGRGRLHRKPFSPRELVARVRAVTVASTGGTGDEILHRRLVIDTAKDGDARRHADGCDDDRLQLLTALARRDGFSRVRNCSMPRAARKSNPSSARSTRTSRTSGASSSRTREALATS